MPAIRAIPSGCNTVCISMITALSCQHIMLYVSINIKSHLLLPRPWPAPLLFPLPPDGQGWRLRFRLRPPDCPLPAPDPSCLGLCLIITSRYINNDGWKCWFIFAPLLQLSTNHMGCRLANAQHLLKSSPCSDIIFHFEIGKIWSISHPPSP